MGIFICPYLPSVLRKKYTLHPKTRKQNLGPQLSTPCVHGKYVLEGCECSKHGGRESYRKQATCPCHVLSCVEEAVWTSSQLRLDEAYCAFRSCSRSLPAVLPRALPRHHRKPSLALSSLKDAGYALQENLSRSLGPCLTCLYHTFLQSGAVGS